MHNKKINILWEKVMGISESSDGEFSLSHYVIYDSYADNGIFVLIGKKSIDNSAHRLWFVITDENLNNLYSEYYNGTLDDKYSSFAPVNSRFGIIETNVGFLAVIENFNYDTQRTSS